MLSQNRLKAWSEISNRKETVVKKSEQQTYSINMYTALDEVGMKMEYYVGFTEKS